MSEGPCELFYITFFISAPSAAFEILRTRVLQY